jgi:hypothetical protein
MDTPKPTLSEILRELRQHTVEAIYQSLFTLHATGTMSAPAVPMLFGVGENSEGPCLYSAVLLDAAQMPATALRMVIDYPNVDGILGCYLSPEGIVTAVIERGGLREGHLYPLTAHAFGVDMG